MAVRTNLKIVNYVLKVIALGGALSLIGARIDTLKLLKVAKKEISRRQRQYVGEVIEKLVEDGLIDRSESGFLTLSKDGRKKFEEIEVQEDVIIRPNKWDGKYRVIIFDIKEDKKLIRKAIREQLIRWGFIRLQNSVWVYPYECDSYIGLLKTRYGVVKDVLYLTVESIENDRWLRREFSLV